MPIGDAARHHVLCSDAPHRGHLVHSRIRLHRHTVTWGIPGHPGRDGRARPRVGPPDRRVLVVTGDGEILMGLGALATIGVQRPQSLSIAVFDNGRYGETGMQASHTDAAVSLPAVACACGIEHAFDITNEPALREFSTLIAQRAGDALRARRDHRRRHAARGAATGRSAAQDPLFAGPLVLRLDFSVQLLSGAESIDF